MKNIKLNIIALIALILGFGGCVDQEFDAPDLGNLPAGDALNISQIKERFETQGSYTFDTSAYLFATVVGDESSGTFYKELYVQDSTGGLNIKMNASANNVSVGDYVKIVLSDLTVNDYNSLIQLQNVEPAFDIIVLENGHDIAPELISVAQLNTLEYTGKLIKLENMQFIDAELTSVFAPDQQTVNRNIQNCDKDNVTIRSSGYSNFNDQVIGEVAPGKGSIIAIASRYGETAQIYIRNINEVDFTGERCTVEQVDPVDVLNEDFNTLEDYGDPEKLLGWKNYVKIGDRGWQAKSFSGDIYVQASGYNSGLSEMETWLITPPLDLSAGDRAFGFQSSIAYWEHATGTHPAKIKISTDYDGNNMDVATWTELSMTLAGEGSANYSWVSSGEVDLSAYSGTGYIAFTYTGSDTESTTFAIDNFDFNAKGATIYAGGSSTDGTGTGTYDDPYDVVNAIANQGETEKWITGYLVGVYETLDENGDQLQDFVPKFDGSYYTNSNVIIAADPEETNISNCVVVQLTSGEIRTATNLVDNPSNEGQEVMYLGSLEAYFGVSGLKGTTGYWFNGNGIIPEPPEGFFIEEFTTTLGQFSGYSVSGDQAWEWASFGGGCAKMSGYAGGNYENEDWLISPVIDMTGKTNVVLNFTQAVNYLDTWDNLKVLVSEDYSGSGDPSSATWTEITGWDQTNPGSSWDFYESGEVSMSAYDGKIIYLAFKYVSSTSAGSTWEVGEVVLSEK